MLPSNIHSPLFLSHTHFIFLLAERANVYVCVCVSALFNFFFFPLLAVKWSTWIQAHEKNKQTHTVAVAHRVALFLVPAATPSLAFFFIFIFFLNLYIMYICFISIYTSSVSKLAYFSHVIRYTPPSVFSWDSYLYLYWTLSLGGYYSHIYIYIWHSTTTLIWSTYKINGKITLIVKEVGKYYK